MSRSISTFDRGVRISDRAISRARIPESAIHHWPLTEGSGSTATDVIGGEHGDIVGATWNEHNEFFDGAALEFDDTDDHVATSLNCVDLSPPITFAVTTVPFETGEGCLLHAYEPNVDTRWTLSYDRDGIKHSDGLVTRVTTILSPQTPLIPIRECVFLLHTI